MVQTDVEKKVQLVDGVYTPKEALNVISSLLDAKIDFHNLRSLSEWVQDCNCDVKEPQQRIKELKQEKANFRDIVKMAIEADAKIRIEGTLEISFLK